MAYASSTPAIAYVGDTISLRSTAPGGTPVSSDPDGDALLYQWTKTAGPAGLTIPWAGATPATATFVAPAKVPAGNYTLQFQLQVRDRASGGLAYLEVDRRF